MREHGIRRALLAAATLLAIGSFSCGTEQEAAAPAAQAPSQGPPPAVARFHSRGASVVLPDGWTATHRPPSTVTDPRPLITAASYDLDPERPTSCVPEEALEQKPPGGALVTFWRNGRDHGRLRDVPRRPASFSLSRSSRGNFECSGRSYAFSYREGGRIFGINVWLEPGTADPGVQREAERLLDSLELATE